MALCPTCQRTTAEREGPCALTRPCTCHCGAMRRLGWAGSPGCRRRPDHRAAGGGGGFRDDPKQRRRAVGRDTRRPHAVDGAGDGCRGDHSRLQRRSSARRLVPRRGGRRSAASARAGSARCSRRATGRCCGPRDCSTKWCIHLSAHSTPPSVQTAETYVMNKTVAPAGPGWCGTFKPPGPMGGRATRNTGWCCC